MKKLLVLFAFLTLTFVVKAQEANAEAQVNLDVAYIKTSTADATASKPATGKGYVLGVSFSTGTCTDAVEIRDFSSGVAQSSGPLLAKVFNVLGSTAAGAFAYDAGQTGCNGIISFPVPIPFYRGLNLITTGTTQQNGAERVIWYQTLDKR